MAKSRSLGAEAATNEGSPKKRQPRATETISAQTGVSRKKLEVADQAEVVPVKPSKPKAKPVAKTGIAGKLLQAQELLCTFYEETSQSAKLHQQELERLNEAHRMEARQISMLKQTDLDRRIALKTLVAILGIYARAGEYLEVIRLGEIIRPEIEMTIGPNRSATLITLFNLGQAYRSMGKWTQADAYQRQFTEGRRSHEKAATDLDNELAIHSLSLLQQQKFQEAEWPARETLAIRDKTRPDHWLRFNAMSFLGESLAGQKKFVEAEPLLINGYDGLKQREKTIPLEFQSMRLTKAAERLIQLYQAWDKPGMMAKWKTELESLQLNLQTETPPAIVENR